MFVKDRHEYIVQMVNQEGSVRVKELSAKFQVTEDCIRKDLSVLEKEGHLKRAYGGAIAARQNVHKLRVKDRQDGPKTERIEIAKKALRLLRDGDVVFLDISTSSIEIAHLLQDIKQSITVITNMIDVLNILSNTSTISLIFLGGQLNEERDGFNSPMTIQLISLFKIDLAFIGVVGVDPFEGSLTTYTMDGGYMKEAVLGVSKKSYLLCEADKFKKDGNFVYGHLNDVQGVLCGSKLSTNIRNALKKYQIQIL